MTADWERSGMIFFSLSLLGPPELSFLLFFFSFFPLKLISCQLIFAGGIKKERRRKGRKLAWKRRSRRRRRRRRVLQRKLVAWFSSFFIPCYRSKTFIDLLGRRKKGSQLLNRKKLLPLSISIFPSCVLHLF